MANDASGAVVNNNASIKAAILLKLDILLAFFIFNASLIIIG